MSGVSPSSEEQDAAEDWLSSESDLLAGKTLSATQQKQLLKTLRFLRDDIQYRHPHQKLPSTWVLKNIVCVARCSPYRAHKWRSDLTKVLNEIQALVILEQDGVTQFFNEDLSKRLFPTVDGFDIDDLSGFILAIKSHLDSVSTC